MLAAMSERAVRRVRELTGGPSVLDGLTGSDLTTFLLDVFRRRARERRPADVLRRYREDRFATPGTVDLLSLRRAEDALLTALPPGTDTVSLAPLVPLGTHWVLGGVDPRKAVATVRGTEVAADSTVGLALEAAARRTGAGTVRLATTQRVTRAQLFDGAGAHFQLFAFVTAGRGPDFEREHLAEHLRFLIEALRGREFRIALTCLDRQGEAIAESVRSLPGVVDDPTRERGRDYYRHLCFKVFLTGSEDRFEIGDGGFTDWTAKLLSDRKERLLTTAIGVDRLALHARTG